MNAETLPKMALVFLVLCTIGTAQLQEISAKPIFRYVEFNGEQKWLGQTHIIKYGIMLRVVAALKEPHKQSMKADLIIIDENGDARTERMTRFDSDGINEWHEYSLDTKTLNPGPYRVRIRAWNTAREAEYNEAGEETVSGVESEEVEWGDLYLSLQVSEDQAQPPKIPGFPWEGVILGIIVAIPVIISRKGKAPLRMRNG